MTRDAARTELYASSVPTPSALEQMNASPKSSNLFNWIRGSAGTQNGGEAIPAERNIPQLPAQRRLRSDSSALTPDEALNISRANAKPVNIPKARVGGSDIADDKPHAKYNSLGLIIAFSGGPGSF